MPLRAIAALLCSVGLVSGACAVHQHAETGDGGKVEGRPAGGDPAAAPKGEKPRREKADVRAIDPAAPEGDCSLPRGLLPVAPGIGQPRLVAPDTVAIEQSRALIDLGADGRLQVRGGLSLVNRGADDARIVIGYAWRLPRPDSPEPVGNLGFEGHQATSCAIPGPEKMVSRYTDVGHWVEVRVPAGGSVEVSCAYEAQADHSAHPRTLFGFADRFARNWKNFDWSYISDPAYSAQLASAPGSFHAVYNLAPAENTRVVLRSAERANWMRGMSHEQAGLKERMLGSYAWAFRGQDTPAAVELEYAPGADAASEIDVFEKLVGTRPDDLRAHIHLADLLRFHGDRARRAELLGKLLKIWDDTAAEDQLMSGRNDLRGPAYVAAFLSLSASGEHGRASATARRGVALIESLPDTGARSAGEPNRLALEWLRARSKEKKERMR